MKMFDPSHSGDFAVTDSPYWDVEFPPEHITVFSEPG